MTPTTDEAPPKQKPTYEQHRNARKAARKQRKADKPKGIDFPIWKAMPKPMLIVFGVVALITLVFVVAVLVKPPTPHIAVADRRSAPSDSLSHDVGPIIVAPIPDVLPSTKSPCEAMEGVTIEGGEGAQIRLGGVMERMCVHATGQTPTAQAMRALSKATIRFARFARTGDISTLSIVEPVRILINIKFAQRDISALYIAPLLAHEGFHLLHKDEPWSAALELQARQVELETCKLMIDVRAWPRGCTDARGIVEFGEQRAIDQLVQAGFPK